MVLEEHFHRFLRQSHINCLCESIQIHVRHISLVSARDFLIKFKKLADPFIRLRSIFRAVLFIKVISDEYTVLIKFVCWLDFGSIEYNYHCSAHNTNFGEVSNVLVVIRGFAKDLNFMVPTAAYSYTRFSTESRRPFNILKMDLAIAIAVVLNLFRATEKVKKIEVE